jgi:hypothetical protein
MAELQHGSSASTSLLQGSTALIRTVRQAAEETLEPLEQRMDAARYFEQSVSRTAQVAQDLARDRGTLPNPLNTSAGHGLEEAEIQETYR